MFFSKSFEAAINQLSAQISSQDCVGRNYLDLSIQAWCSYLDLLEEEEAYIEEGFKSQGFQPRITQDYLNGDIFLALFGENKTAINATAFINKFDKRIRWESHRVKFYLLLAFVIVSVGYTLFIVSGKFKKQNFQDRRSQLSLPNASHSWPAQLSEHNFLLILVVNAKHENIIHTLKNNNGIITLEVANQLYHATQELWLGSEQQYLNLPIETFFKNQSNQETSSPSEYDVFFIKIRLIQKDSGFEDRVSQLSRADGFTRLPKIAQKVEVSNRLSSKSYENIGVYSR